MLNGLLLLLTFYFIGEYLFQTLPFKIPGAVWGLMLLTLVLVLRQKPVSKETETPANILIHYLGLLFVPAGVGIINYLAPLWENALSVTVALLGSTVLCLWVTGMFMQRLCKTGER